MYPVETTGTSTSTLGSQEELLPSSEGGETQDTDMGEPGPPTFGKDCIQSPPEVQCGV